MLLIILSNCKNTFVERIESYLSLNYCAFLQQVKDFVIGR